MHWPGRVSGLHQGLQVGSRNLEMKAYTLYVSCFSALLGLGVDFGLQTCRYSMKVNVR